METIEELFVRYPQLKGCEGEIAKAFDLLLTCYRNGGKVLTCGNSANCVNAALVAKAKGMKVVALTGSGGGKLGNFADAAIKVPEMETYKIQELHLPVYHALCAALEEVVW